MASFINPALLAGAVLIAAPFILHLIMRQKPRFLEFPALRFVRQAHESNRRTFRLRHWLLLLLRAAAIALLALALARPTIQSSTLVGEREGPVAVAMVFDTLPHMEYRAENRTRLEVAQEQADWLLTQLPHDSQVGVIDSSPGLASFQIDLGAARQRIGRLSIRGTGDALARSLDRAVELLETSDLPREIYVFSDLTSAAWHVDNAERLQAKLQSLRDVAIYVIDVGVSDPQDFALGVPRLSGQVLARNTPLGLTSEVRRLGPAGTKVVECYVLDAAGRPQKRSQESLDVPTNEAVSVEFYLGGLDEGTHQGYLRMVGADGLAADDARFFTCEVRRAWHVLIVAPEPADESAFFLTEALAPAAFRKNEQARFRCDTRSYAALADVDLPSYQAVCLLDPPPLDESSWQKLGSYAAGGGGVLIALGPHATPIETFNRPAALELLAGPLASQARYPDADLALVVERSTQHPLLSRFIAAADAVAWDQYPIFRYWRLEALTAGVQTLMTFTNGSPAVLEKPLGRGRVLTVTTPLGDAPATAPRDRWNELATGFEPWPFVMLTNEMALYLVGARSSDLNYLAGQPAVLRLSDEPRFATYLVTTPDGDQFRQTADQGEEAIFVSSTDSAGNYRVQAGGENGRFDRGFSVNLAPSATDLTRLDDAQLQSVFGDVPFQLAHSRAEIDRKIAASRVGHELFPFIIGLVALALGVEHWLANRFYRDKSDAKK